MGIARLVAESHGAGGSRGDFIVTPPLQGFTHVCVNVYWGCAHTSVHVFAVQHDGTVVTLYTANDWQKWSSVLAELDYEGDAFPLRNNPYLGWDYKKEMGWLTEEELAKDAMQQASIDKAREQKSSPADGTLWSDVREGFQFDLELRGQEYMLWWTSAENKSWRTCSLRIKEWLLVAEKLMQIARESLPGDTEGEGK